MAARNPGDVAERPLSPPVSPVLSRGGGSEPEVRGSGSELERPNSNSGQSLSRSINKLLAQRGVENTDNWSTLRFEAFRMWNSRLYDFSLVGSIVATIVLVVLETDAYASGNSPARWVSLTSDLILALFVADLALRIFILRAGYFSQLGNWADLAIVGADLCMVIYGYLSNENSSIGLSFLRIFRLLKLGQAMHVLVSFPELHLMIKGMAGAFKTIVWGAVVLLLILLVWSILAVQIIHPWNRDLALAGVYEESRCERCPRAFESVGASMLTMVKHLLAGDGWGEVCVPLIEAFPWTFVFFLAVITTVSLAILNLILAVIVDSATRARSESDHDLAALKDIEFKKQKKSLTRLFRKLDKDGNGMLTWDELNDALSEQMEFVDSLTCLGITTQDLEMVWMILDEEDLGKVLYTKFVDQMCRLRSEDSQYTILFIKSLLIRMRRDLTNLADGGVVATRSLMSFRSRQGAGRSLRTARSQLGRLGSRHYEGQHGAGSGTTSHGAPPSESVHPSSDSAAVALSYPMTVVSAVSSLDNGERPPAPPAPAAAVLLGPQAEQGLESVQRLLEEVVGSIRHAEAKLANEVSASFRRHGLLDTTPRGSLAADGGGGFGFGSGTLFHGGGRQRPRPGLPHASDSLQEDSTQWLPGRHHATEAREPPECGHAPAPAAEHAPAPDARVGFQPPEQRGSRTSAGLPAGRRLSWRAGQQPADL